MNSLPATSTRPRLWPRVALGLLLALALAAAAIAWLNLRGEDAIDDAPPPALSALDAAQVERGAYLARAGNCMACHTARGGAAGAGGRPIETPFGIVYSSNLTPDDDTGLGRWNASHFWRALHNGRSRDGRLLYPAFPYPNYTEITREDSDALYAWLRTLPAARQPNAAHDLASPFDTQAALAVWRALYFRAGTFEPAPAQGAQWNRGAYLVRGLGHCAACHSARNALGGSEDASALAGGLIPVQNWYAPSLSAPTEAGVAHWSRDEVVKLLRDGYSAHGQVTGPMAEVVLYSTQHLSAADLDAMATYLQALPPRDIAPRPRVDVPPQMAARGEAIYTANCINCHGARGEGVPGAYPPLAGNRAVTMNNPANLVQIVLYGGFGPATAGHPRPFGMPPYVLALSDEDVASVLTHIRGQWGNRAPAVSTLDVARVRGGPPR
ncbi:MAG: cytochrome c [Burkholderiaceae bacterium]|nr:cytochrome c [Burkholderiaceae bacterium]